MATKVKQPQNYKLHVPMFEVSTWGANLILAAQRGGTCSTYLGQDTDFFFLPSHLFSCKTTNRNSVTLENKFSYNNYELGTLSINIVITCMTQLLQLVHKRGTHWLWHIRTCSKTEYICMNMTEVFLFFMMHEKTNILMWFCYAMRKRGPSFWLPQLWVSLNL